METVVGIEGKAVIHLEELVCGVSVALSECDVGDGVDDFDVIVRRDEGNKGIFVRFLLGKKCVTARSMFGCI